MKIIFYYFLAALLVSCNSGKELTVLDYKTKLPVPECYIYMPNNVDCDNITDTNGKIKLKGNKRKYKEIIIERRDYEFGIFPLDKSLNSQTVEINSTNTGKAPVHTTLLISTFENKLKFYNNAKCHLDYYNTHYKLIKPKYYNEIKNREKLIRAFRNKLHSHCFNNEKDHYTLDLFINSYGILDSFKIRSNARANVYPDLPLSSCVKEFINSKFNFGKVDENLYLEHGITQMYMSIPIN